MPQEPIDLEPFVLAVLQSIGESLTKAIHDGWAGYASGESVEIAIDAQIAALKTALSLDSHEEISSSAVGVAGVAALICVQSLVGRAMTPASASHPQVVASAVAAATPEATPGSE